MSAGVISTPDPLTAMNPNDDNDTGSIVPLDAEFAFLMLTVTLTILLLPGFDRSVGRQLRALNVLHHGTVMMMIGAGLLGNIMIYIRHTHNGLQCVHYEGLVFINPSTIAAPLCAIALYMLCDGEHLRQSRGEMRTRCLRWLPEPATFQRRGVYCIVVAIGIHVLVAIGVLVVRYHGNIIDAANKSCRLNMELPLLMIMFFVYICFFIFVLVFTLHSPPDGMWAAVWSVRLAVIWSAVTLMLFLMINMSPAEAFEAFESTFWRVEVFAMAFNLGPALFILLVFQVLCIYVDGGYVFFFYVRGTSKEPRSIQMVAPSQHKDAAEMERLFSAEWDGMRAVTEDETSVAETRELLRDAKKVVPRSIHQMLEAYKPGDQTDMVAVTYFIKRLLLRMSQGGWSQKDLVDTTTLLIREHQEAVSSHQNMINTPGLAGTVFNLRDRHGLDSIGNAGNLRDTVPGRVAPILSDLAYMIAFVISRDKFPEEEDVVFESRIM
jgi:hypothetical protein